MSDYQVFVGIDVSKKHLDISIMESLKVSKYVRISNTPKAIKSFLDNYAQEYQLAQALFCLEATGVYISHLVALLATYKHSTWVENAVSIKRSLGLQRGKNDKVDSKRIAEYATRFVDKVKLYQPPSEAFEHLQVLENLRTAFVETKKRLQTNAKEIKAFMKKSTAQLVQKHTKDILKALEIQIKEVEKQTYQIIKADPELKKLYEIACSVPGVGPVIATAVLIATKGFKKFNNAKEFACYCGVAPFEHSSGNTSSKPRVSKMANKKLKKLLHLGAMSATRTKGEIKEYYEKKIKENKPKMSILNAVRNKIIQRIFTCVNKGENYQRTLQKKIANTIVFGAFVA